MTADKPGTVPNPPENDLQKKNAREASEGNQQTIQGVQKHQSMEERKPSQQFSAPDVPDQS